MKTLRRLYLGDFLRFFLLITFGLAVIFSLLELVDRLDEFMPGAASAVDLALFAAFRVPKYLVYLLPMSVLISSLFIFSQAYRRHEITAIKASGGRVRSLFITFISLGVLLSIVSFITGEVLVPDFSRRALDLKNRLKGKSGDSLFDAGSLWIKSRNGSPVKIDVYDVEARRAQGIHIFDMTDGVVGQRIEARSASWEGGQWVLRDVMFYDFAKSSVEERDSLPYDGLESPDFFEQDVMKPDDMGIAELYRYSTRLREAGFQNNRITVDINGKISFPFVNIFMMILGISLSARGGLGSGLLSAGVALLISLAYWLGHTFTLMLGYSGVIPGFLSAWIAPAAVGILSLYLYLQVPE